MKNWSEYVIYWSALLYNESIKISPGNQNDRTKEGLHVVFHRISFSSATFLDCYQAFRRMMITKFNKYCAPFHWVFYLEWMTKIISEVGCGCVGCCFRAACFAEVHNHQREYVLYAWSSNISGKAWLNVLQLYTFILFWLIPRFLLYWWSGLIRCDRKREAGVVKIRCVNDSHWLCFANKLNVNCECK